MSALVPPAGDPVAHRQFEQKSSYDYPYLLAYANREFGDDLPPLPLPPWLMFHRIIEISATGGAHNLGFAIAEYDITPETADWFFRYHFKRNPIMPGALGIDGVFQLGGIFLPWIGARGMGMAISFGGGKFRGMVTPDSRIVQFRVDVNQLKFPSSLSTVKVDGRVTCDGKLIYEMYDFAVGVKSQSKAA
ncbi:hypothetical protein A3C20_03275 [Candidatus Kaiserbacteria bacterium RIFCSPHIGHO2_02_FULL_55_25]|uniref:Uncharacterized protein n=1 Tax=Candidatus Kaiserbacteria bacterium RIFCSPHIGHO2_02_FULL_55_25 TaxID=1798498 RepID=A0A1F6E6N7_9BACT|nr:MAG: hypothetical protein A2764_00255 [Candidatus Kaiserbacteria bacterium RIFCSPHIGHO2_01_FULL_55_79]OGG69291.1 MAG: hypothetical protein A3C20_03275 [Candidatus Kaiserbacteria bacterium RIFCSPHIGHO2_02_FULL_55_25]OGG77054.1 MAG: hypothetical protein A3F56_01170 [Candidatus Kaiserbacteria bacterium RIFCSPHIGHO2_12_FULL_55_13]OGG83942.1 MAG: hypothetical protein A3A42_00280 [Candidatus Kaiserbacteria bacterium RIFCSPLOWO2_01_FULL_55_25]